MNTSSSSSVNGEQATARLVAAASNVSGKQVPASSDTQQQQGLEPQDMAVFVRHASLVLQSITAFLTYEQPVLTTN